MCIAHYIAKLVVEEEKKGILDPIHHTQYHKHVGTKRDTLVPRLEKFSYKVRCTTIAITLSLWCFLCTSSFFVVVANIHPFSSSPIGYTPTTMRFLLVPVCFPVSWG